ncbi:hypothetical protein NSU_0895 [Novosphingobium pentaromativorans US6-1]|uniref:Uncharacterized protein n=1 Tax=Novosphingobium pentaromativorans US6-1 TaxID=1088721 RepID=G6E974_9SPHN|nr:hypothetical protein NSU_0895 [Novosphingobium pentaromativorans US6-1]
MGETHGERVFQICSRRSSGGVTCPQDGMQTAYRNGFASPRTNWQNARRVQVKV